MVRYLVSTLTSDGASSVSWPVALAMHVMTFRGPNQTRPRYKNDIDLARETGATSMRISLEWNRIQPTPAQGVYDEDVLAHYEAIMAYMKTRGMTVMLTLHHFVHPLWFEEQGGFFEFENVLLFARWARDMSFRFGQYVDYWVTMNEPAVFALTTHIVGIFPPGRTGCFHRAGIILLHMLRAHTLAYEAIKAQAPHAQVGFVHQFMRFQGSWGVCWPSALVAKWMTSFFANDCIVRWFQEGYFCWQKPGWLWNSRIEHRAPAKPPTDFIGINYYSRIVIGPVFNLTGTRGELLSDSSFPVYPEGLTEHLVSLKPLNVPVFVTEFGCADRSDNVRPTLIREYYAAALKAMTEGVDLRGMFFWTLIDNFEWHEGFRQCFGLYSFERGTAEAAGTLERSPRVRSIAVLRAIHDLLPDRLSGVAADVGALVASIQEIEIASAGSPAPDASAVPSTDGTNVPKTIKDAPQATGPRGVGAWDSCEPGGQDEQIVLEMDQNALDAAVR